MFTGLVEEIGRIKQLSRTTHGATLVVEAQRVLEGTVVGDSVAVSGACLTVVELGKGQFSAELMPETLSRTTLGSVEIGRRVNLERSLALGARLGGHLVLGHVDAVGTVLEVRRTGSALLLRLSLPTALRPYVVTKGSVAIDGVSLTVLGCTDDCFEVGIIPHTFNETTVGDLKSGLSVNLEADALARYVHRLLEVQGMRTAGTGAPEGLTERLLREKGFI